MTERVVLCGLGGQGIVRAAAYLGRIAMGAGYVVRSQPSYGVSQAAGSVACQVRFGRDLSSGLVGSGEADWVLAAEQFEGERLQGLLRPGGQLVVADRVHPPNSLYFRANARAEPSLLNPQIQVPVTELLAAHDLPMACSGLVMLGWILDRLISVGDWPEELVSESAVSTSETLAIQVGHQAHLAARIAPPAK